MAANITLQAYEQAELEVTREEERKGSRIHTIGFGLVHSYEINCHACVRAGGIPDEVEFQAKSGANVCRPTTDVQYLTRERTIANACPALE